MKATFAFLMAICFCFSSKAQDEEPIINEKYPYRVTHLAISKDLLEGIYLFKTDLDYFNFQSGGEFNPIFSPPFFSCDEMGLLIYEKDPYNGISRKIESIIETSDRILVNITILESSITLPVVTDFRMFLALKKSDKEVVVTERKSPTATYDRFGTD